MTNGVDARSAAAEFDRTAVPDVESAAESDRQKVLSQFPLEEWAELPLERYDRHGVSADDVHQLLTYGSGYASADAPMAVIVYL